MKNNIKKINFSFLFLFIGFNFFAQNAINLPPFPPNSSEESSQIIQGQQPLSKNTQPSIQTVNCFKTARGITKFDYTYWSSQTDGQTLHDVSPNTLSDKFLKFDPVQGWIIVYNGSQVMNPGIGYAIRGPSIEPWTSTRADYTAYMCNGNINSNPVYPVNITVSPSYGVNLLGNPYPDALSADCFILDPDNQNSIGGALIFWTHNIPVDFSGGTPNLNNGEATINYNQNDYAIYNLLGGVGTGVILNTSNGISPNRPNGYVSNCQGFFVQALSNGTAYFKDTMLSSDPNDNTQFFKESNQTQSVSPCAVPNRNRLWLTITNNGNLYRETLVGYAPNATTSTSLDRNYDFPIYLQPTDINLYSLAPVSGGNNRMMIQGRQLTSPFDTSDVIPLGYSVSSPNGATLTIKVDDADGLFLTQKYLLREDTGNGFIYHDIKNTPYTFTTNGPVANDDTRFQIVFIPCNQNIICGNGNELNVPVTAGATSYEWHITNLFTQVEEVITLTGTSANSFDITSDYVPTPGLAFWSYDTSYLYYVIPYINGVAQASTQACIANIIAPPAIKARKCNPSTPVRFCDNWCVTNDFPSSNCLGKNLNIRVTGPTGPNSSVYTFQIPWGGTFNLTNPSYGINPSFDQTYTVEVQIDNLGGIPLSFGAPFTITTPSCPIPQITSFCGQIVTSKTSYINCNFTAVNALIPCTHKTYVFRLSNSSGYSATWENLSQGVGQFQLNKFIGLQTNTSYLVEVAVRVNGVLGPWSSSVANYTPCIITTPGTLRTSNPNSSEEITVVSNPNPFQYSFTLVIDSPIKDPVSIKVYDMQGKLVDDLKIDYINSSNLQIGEKYASGIYNIIVTQGEFSQTLRIVKN